MKVLIRNSDNAVIYAQEDINLTSEGVVGDDWIDPNFTTINARIEDAPLPDDWIGGMFSYSDSTWTILDIERYNTIQAENRAKHDKEALASYDKALTNYLDSVAQSKRYDNRITCALRAGYSGPFQTEGIAFAQWMDNCNALGQSLLLDFQEGRIPQPTIAEFLATMPPMIWPE